LNRASHGERNRVTVARVGERLAQRARPAVVSVSDRDDVGRSVSLSRGSLCEREWNCADGHKQKQVKHASKKMRFNGRDSALLHFACVPVSKLLLLEARQNVETFRVRKLTAL
jgi:hypothetical protein